MKARQQGTSRDLVVDDPEARGFYHDSGYGRITDDGLSLSPVEARHLDRRGKIDVEEDAASPDPAVYAVYSDLRERGFYLQHRSGDSHVERYPRGVHPSDGEATRVEVTDEGGEVDVSEPAVYAVFDREHDVTYFDVREWTPEGGTAKPESSYRARETGGGYVVEDAGELFNSCFYGAPLEDEGGMEITDEETRYLYDVDVLDVDEPPRETRETRVYGDLRDSGMCPRTGFKFGTAFRVYDTVTDASDLPHSGYLVEPVDTPVSARDLSRYVRLAHGVRKTMVFALPDDGYVAVERETP